MNQRKIILRIVQTGILSALSVILYLYAKFPVAVIFPAFLDIQFSVLPAMIAGMSLGPLWGLIVVLIKFIIKLLTSSTAGIGETIDLIIGIVAVSTSSIVFRILKDKKGSIIALLSAFAGWVIISAFANYFLIIPFYEKVIGIQSIINACPDFLGLTSENYRLKIVLFGIIPFNTLLASLTCILTYLTHWRLAHRLFDPE